MLPTYLLPCQPRHGRKRRRSVFLNVSFFVHSVCHSAANERKSVRASHCRRLFPRLRISRRIPWLRNFGASRACRNRCWRSRYASNPVSFDAGLLLLDGHHHLLPSLFPRVVHLPLYLVITSLSVHPAFFAFRYLVAMSGDVRVCVYECVFYSMLGNFLMLLDWSCYFFCWWKSGLCFGFSFVTSRRLFWGMLFFSSFYSRCGFHLR